MRLYNGHIPMNFLNTFQVVNKPQVLKAGGGTIYLVVFISKHVF